jgi:hypothetical protein
MPVQQGEGIRLLKYAPCARIFFNNLQGVKDIHTLLQTMAKRSIPCRQRHSMFLKRLPHASYLFSHAPMTFHGLLKRQNGNKLNYRLLFKTLGVESFRYPWPYLNLTHKLYRMSFLFRTRCSRDVRESSSEMWLVYVPAELTRHK